MAKEVMYNHKEGWSYKKKKDLQAIKRSIIAIQDSNLSVTDLQDKYVLLLKVMYNNNFYNVVGKITETKIHPYILKSGYKARLIISNKETKEQKSYYIDITIKDAFVFSCDYDNSDCCFSKDNVNATWSNISEAKLLTQPIKEQIVKIINKSVSYRLNKFHN